MIFGRGNACPGRPHHGLPCRRGAARHRRTDCDWAGIDPYVAIPAATIDGDKTALAAMSATDDEITNTPDYWNWDAIDPLRDGCLEGGWIAYRARAAGYRLDLHACAFSRGLPLAAQG